MKDTHFVAYFDQIIKTEVESNDKALGTVEPSGELRFPNGTTVTPEGNTLKLAYKDKFVTVEKKITATPSGKNVFSN